MGARPLVMLGVVLAAAGGAGFGRASAQKAETKVSLIRESATRIAQDRRLGMQALLRLSDFPAGWTAGERHPSPHEPELAAEYAACLHVSRSLLDQHDPAEVKSPKFKEARGLTISNSVTVTPSTNAAAKYFSVYIKPRTRSCLTRELRKGA